MVVDYSSWLAVNLPSPYGFQTCVAERKVAVEVLGVSNPIDLGNNVQRYTYTYIKEVDYAPYFFVVITDVEIGPTHKDEKVCGPYSTAPSRYSFKDVNLPITLKTFPDGSVGVDFTAISRTMHHTFSTNAKKLPIFENIDGFLVNDIIGYVSIVVVPHIPFKVLFELEYPLGTINTGTKSYSVDVQNYACSIAEIESTSSPNFTIDGSVGASYNLRAGCHLITGTFSLKTLPPSDIRIESLTLDKENVLTDEELTAEILFKNHGGSSGEGTFPLYLNNSKISDISSGELNAGATGIKTVMFSIPTKGEYQVCI